MNAFRKISLVVLVALVAVFAVGVLGSSAFAGHGHGHGNGHGHGHSNGHGHGHFHGHGHAHGHWNYPSYNHGTYWPSYEVAKPISYPVTYYDCYGRPYIVWQTSYGTNPVW